ncbi:MAG: protelomerase family protein [Cyanobacteria bacterium P01_A01_bin.84]
MTTTTVTKTDRLADISQELKLNLRHCIARSKSKVSCEKFVEATMYQIAEGNFSKSAIRRTIPKAIKELKSSLKIKGYGKLIFTVKGKAYTNYTGETVQNEYEQHYAFTALYAALNSFGLVMGNASGHFTIDELEGKLETTEPEEIEGAKPQKQVEKKDTITTAVGELTAIDFTKYLKLAKKCLQSDEWETRLLGVQMAIPRRSVEVGSQMRFYEVDKYSLVISTPAKKDEQDTYYLIPCFVDSKIICDAIEFIRDNKPRLKSDTFRAFGQHKKANEIFNNSERKNIVDKKYEEILRPLLPKAASTKNKDNVHQLKNIGTTVLFQLKSDSVGNLAGQKHGIEEWVRKAVAHTFKGTTDRYITWNVTNIPEELKALTDIEPRQVSPEFVGEKVKTENQTNQTTGVEIMTALFEKLLTLAANDEGKLQTVKAVFMDDDNNFKETDDIASGLNEIFQYVSDAKSRQDAIHKALNIPTAKTKNEDRVEALVDSIIIHNRENPSLRVHISDSTIRGFFAVYPGKDGKGASINILLVRKIVEQNNIQEIIDKHNEEYQLDAKQNLLWRKEKGTIIENLKRIIQDNYSHAI